MFCQNCGVNLSEGSGFCSECGTKTQQGNVHTCTSCGAALPKDAAFCVSCGASAHRSSATTAAPVQQESIKMQSMSLVGFSSRYNHPEILAAAQKSRKTAIGCAWILVFVPLIGFPIAGLLMDDFPFGESVVVGIVIAFVMLVFNLFFFEKHQKTNMGWHGSQ